MTVAHYLDLRIFATTDDYINITRIKAYHIFSVQYIQIFTRLNKSFKIFLKRFSFGLSEIVDIVFWNDPWLDLT